jgi:RimJ/RimL family protein N-acetyltransferase
MVNLEGTNCNIYSYERDSFKPDIFHKLFALMEEDEDSYKVLWPFEYHDLIQFIQCISDPHVLLFIIFTKDYKDFVGFTWFNEVVPHFKAHANLFIRKKYRKILTDEASKLSLDFMFKHFDLKEIWTHTPWENAHKLSLRLGFTETAVLPDYVLVKNEPQNFYISKLKRG